jgi:prepilin-type N-terminal cleavage/methylation domain-containing protein
MNKQYKPVTKDSRGFTIIEVVLVLAIAGLIFLMVFIALPALQRGQRDTQRKDDLSRINTQISNFISASRSKVPTAATLPTFTSKYLGTSTTGSDCAGPEYVDPSGDQATACPGANDGYNIVYSTSGTPGKGQIYYGDGVKCLDDGTGGTIGTGASSRNYALRILLEGQTAAYCIDNR